MCDQTHAFSDRCGQYPASSNIFGAIRGARDVVSRLKSQSQLCPNQTFALVGYSQGASVMHRAADDIPKSLHSKIKALVMFGDPSQRFGSGKFPAGLQEKVLQNCADGDPVSFPCISLLQRRDSVADQRPKVCDSGTCTYYHLVYIRPEWINKTVDFIVKAFTG